MKLIKSIVILRHLFISRVTIHPRLRQSRSTHLHLICPSIHQYTERLLQGDNFLNSNPGPIYALACIATLFRCFLLEIKEQIMFLEVFVC